MSWLHHPEEFGHARAQFAGALEALLVLPDVASIICRAHGAEEPSAGVGRDHPLEREERHDLEDCVFLASVSAAAYSYCSTDLVLEILVVVRDDAPVQKRLHLGRHIRTVDWRPYQQAIRLVHLLQDLDCIVLNGAVPRFLVAHFAGAARLYHIVSERDQLDIDAGLPERFRALFDHHLGVAFSPGTPVYRQNLHDTVAPVSRESE